MLLKLNSAGSSNIWLHGEFTMTHDGTLSGFRASSLHLSEELFGLEINYK